MRGLYPEKDLSRALADETFGPAKPQPSSASPALVGPNETIGTHDCWCGRPQGHEWIGKEDDAPHPKYPD